MNATEATIIGGKQMVPDDCELPLLRVSVCTHGALCYGLPSTVTYLRTLSREIHQVRLLVVAILIFALYYALALFFHRKIEEDSLLSYLDRYRKHYDITSYLLFFPHILSVFKNTC